MANPTPTLGYPTRQEAVEALQAKGLTVGQIAKRIGMTPETVRVTLCHIKYGRKRAEMRPVLVHSKTMDQLHDEAAARGLNVPELIRLLLGSIIAGDLFNAILDDAEE